jgi:hypothetical protein
MSTLWCSAGGPAPLPLGAPRDDGRRRDAHAHALVGVAQVEHRLAIRGAGHESVVRRAAVPIVVDAVERDRARSAVAAAVGKHDVEAKSFELPVRVELHPLALGVVRRVEVRALEPERRAEESARRRRSGRPERVNVELATRALPADEKVRVERVDLGGSVLMK